LERLSQNLDTTTGLVVARPHNRVVPEQASPPADKFKSLDAGVAYTCGERSDDAVVCWGDNTHGQGSPP
jgi:hypothetical protein